VLMNSRNPFIIISVPEIIFSFRNLLKGANDLVVLHG
jgi:hypothetical protein